MDDTEKDLDMFRPLDEGYTSTFGDLNPAVSIDRRSSYLIP